MKKQIKCLLSISLVIMMVFPLVSCGNQVNVDQVFELLYPQEGGKLNCTGAKEILKPIADKGNATASYYLALALFHDYTESNMDYTADYFRKAADAGIGKAEGYLGLLYLRGYGIYKLYESSYLDWEAAAEHLKKAVDSGIMNESLEALGPDGLYLVGRIYDDYYAYQYGVEPDSEKALWYYTQAAEAGNTDAMIELDSYEWLQKAAEMGNTYAMRECASRFYVAGDAESVLYWYQRAANAGDPYAMLELASAYEGGSLLSEDPEEALAWYQRAAKTGAPYAMDKLAWVYRYGEIVAKDEGKALDWYKKAADAGYHDSASSVEGIGSALRSDKVQALNWFLKAADAGDEVAMCYIANMYRNEEDYKKAMDWYQKAIDAGSTSAITAIGVCYRYGYGLERNLEKAMEWFQMAADRGDAGGMWQLASSYRDGAEGISPDPAKALYWYEKLAESGDGTAMQITAEMYEKGEGTPVDLEKAKKWRTESEDLDNRHWRDYVDLVRARSGE